MKHGWDSSPGSGSGRGLIQSVNELREAMKPIETSPFDLIAAKMPAQAEIMTEAQMRVLENALNFNAGFSQIIEDTAESFASGFAERTAHTPEEGRELFLITPQSPTANNSG